MRIVCIDTEAQYREIVERDVVAPLAAAGHEFAWIEGGRFDRPEEAVAAAQGFDALYIIGDQGPLPAGRHDMAVATAGLAPGVYVLRLESGAGSQSARLAVAR